MKSLFFKILCIFLLTSHSLSLLSQVKIDVKINGINDTILYLLKYKSDKTYSIIDYSSTSSLKKTFKNDNNYEEGIYILADSRQNPLFEILLGKDQKFSIRVEDLMDIESYDINGSKETAAYFDVYFKTTYNTLYIKALESEMEYYPDNKNKIDLAKRELYEYQESMLSKDTTSFLNTYIKYIEKNPNHEDSISDLFFESVPLNDIRVLNSRLLKNKLDEYFDIYMSSYPPEYICKKIDDILNKTKETKIRDYILWYLYSKYFNPEDIKNELVYIHLADNYFSILAIDNLTENIRNQIVKRANILRNITLGKQAPTFSYIDDLGYQVSLDEIDSRYTVLFFYKPDCQKCIKDKRALDLLKKKRDDLEVLYINISEENDNVSYDVVDQYDIMTTPTIYLLNENKEIIAKHIKSEEIEFHIINR